MNDARWAWTKELDGVGLPSRGVTAACAAPAAIPAATYVNAVRRFIRALLRNVAQVERRAGKRVDYVGGNGRADLGGYDPAPWKSPVLSAISCVTGASAAT